MQITQLPGEIIEEKSVFGFPTGISEKNLIVH